jgi:hypothetical protein
VQSLFAVHFPHAPVAVQSGAFADGHEPAVATAAWSALQAMHAFVLVLQSGASPVQSSWLAPVHATQ